ncbi:MAG: exosortase/archaeosortase family protein [Verrucomicrobiota bacterium]
MEKISKNPAKLDVLATPAARKTIDWRSPDSIRAAGFLVFTILLTALFGHPLASLMSHAARSDLHSYILLVPFVSAYLIYLRRNELPKMYGSSPGWAIIPLILGLAAFAAWMRLRTFHPASSENDELTLMAFSFVCFLATGGFLFLGGNWMKAAAFPIGFLLFMVPLPDQAVYYMETGSKLASAEAADLFFYVTGTPVFRWGTIFQLPGIVIEVAQECSGIRSSLVLLIASVLAANLFLKSPWRRIALVALVIPLGIIRNGFRIFVIGSLCVHFGPQMIHSAIHRRGGPLFFGLSLIPLFLLLWWLRRGETHDDVKIS